MMSAQIRLARFLIGLGRRIESLALLVMRPEDLIEFSRQTYARPGSLESWGQKELIERGLLPEETALLERLPAKSGRLLLLGVGAGREAIPLARAGFSVTGVDFVPAMVESARANAEKAGVRLEGVVQEISRLGLLPQSYDVVWLSAAMYSCVPTRRRRVDMLRRIHCALRPGGYFLCQFHWDSDTAPSPRMQRLGRALGWLTLGRLAYEPGDMLWHNIEFIHAFRSEAELRAEFGAAGFAVRDLSIYERFPRGDAILQRVPRS